MKKEVVNFVSKVIRQRRAIIRLNKSKKSKSKSYECIKRVSANLIGRNRLTDIAAAKIFIKYKSDIYYIIPSGNYKGYNSLREDYEKILSSCIQKTNIIN